MIVITYKGQSDASLETKIENLMTSRGMVELGTGYAFLHDQRKREVIYGLDIDDDIESEVERACKAEEGIVYDPVVIASLKAMRDDVAITFFDDMHA